jgi:hypothetical protein
MDRPLFQIIVCLIFTVQFACINSSPKTEQQAEKINADTTNIRPDEADLLRVLQGKWQNEFDENYFLEIEGSKLRQVRNGQVAAESDIEVDAFCNSTPCIADSTDKSDGWCFTEKSAGTTRCNLVIYCTKLQLKYQPMMQGQVLQEFRKK